MTKDKVPTNKNIINNNHLALEDNNLNLDSNSNIFNIDDFK